MLKTNKRKRISKDQKLLNKKLSSYKNRKIKLELKELAINWNMYHLISDHDNI